MVLKYTCFHEKFLHVLIINNYQQLNIVMRLFKNVGLIYLKEHSDVFNQ